MSDTESPVVDRIPDELIAKLKAPLPPEAIKQHPTKKYLSTIKSIYVDERLNQVFGVGRWEMHSEVVERTPNTEGVNRDGEPVERPGMVIVKSVMRLLDYPWFYAESFGGNDNADLGDAYKGAVTDSFTKICATKLCIGMDVYKGLGDASAKAAKAEQDKITAKKLKELGFDPDWEAKAQKLASEAKTPADFDAAAQQLKGAPSQAKLILMNAAAAQGLKFDANAHAVPVNPAGNHSEDLPPYSRLEAVKSSPSAKKQASTKASETLIDKSMLITLQTARKRVKIPDQDYYNMLGSYGYEHANEVRVIDLPKILNEINEYRLPIRADEVNMDSEPA